MNDGEKYDSKKDVYEEHMHSIHGPRNAVMLIRLRHEDAVKAVQRDGQEDFHYGDYYAYSKMYPHRLPDVPVRAADEPHSLPVPPVPVRCTPLG